MKTFYFIKSISYRIFSSAITFFISVIVLGDFSLGLKIGIADFVIKIFSFYAHERLWHPITKRRLAKEKHS
jgi:uncharacterized membrane protein